MGMDFHTAQAAARLSASAHARSAVSVSGVCKRESLPLHPGSNHHRKLGFFTKLLTAACVTLPDSSVDSDEEVYYSKTEIRSRAPHTSNSDSRVQVQPNSGIIMRQRYFASSVPVLPSQEGRKVVDIYDNILSSSSLTGKSKKKKLEQIRKICPLSYEEKFGHKSVDEILIGLNFEVESRLEN